ncbi:MAG: hypothetical protein ACXWCY_29665 [Burkholderiales bacterium]
MRPDGIASPSTSATPELCQVIDSLIDSSDVSAEATLSEIRAVLSGEGIFLSGEGELLHPHDRTFLVIELDELIERYGMKAAARDITGYPRA